MRTRGKGEGLIEEKENMRLGWACPTLVACVSSLKPLDFSLFTFHFSLLNIKTREHENKREGEGLIEQKENMRFGWALPNTPFLRYPHLNHWIFHSSLFTLHLTSPLLVVPHRTHRLHRSLRD